MGDRLSPDDARLYRLCDEALFWLWDPIDVRDVPQARDEYNAYLPHVFQLVKAEDKSALVEYLVWVSSEYMGLGTHREAAERAAEFMLEASDWVRKRSDRAGAS
jgi:hypothetical protein